MPSPQCATTVKALGNLQIWQRAVDLAAIVYRLTQAWPKAEAYGMTSQIRRAAVSIPSNIAEGVGRDAPAEICRFSSIAMGSAHELETLLVLARRLGLAADCTHVHEPLTSFIASMHRFIAFHAQRAQRRPDKHLRTRVSTTAPATPPPPAAPTNHEPRTTNAP